MGRLAGRELACDATRSQRGADIAADKADWGAKKKNQMDFYGRRFVAGELDGGEDWSEVARAMGANGVRVNQLEDVGPALTAAIDAQMNGGRTTVIEAMCTMELGDPFRKDALSRPVGFPRMWSAVHWSASHLIWGRPFAGVAVVAALRRSCVTAAPGLG